MNPGYAAYQMFQKSQISMFWEVRKGELTIGHLPEDQLKRLKFTVSPLIEQRKIVDYLTEETAAVGLSFLTSKP